VTLFFYTRLDVQTSFKGDIQIVICVNARLSQDNVIKEFFQGLFQKKIKQPEAANFIAKINKIEKVSDNEIISIKKKKYHTKWHKM